jgi:flagellar biogenesis protein FliO
VSSQRRRSAQWLRSMWVVAALWLLFSCGGAAQDPGEPLGADLSEVAPAGQVRASSPELSPPPLANTRAQSQTPFLPLGGGLEDLAPAPDGFNAGDSVRRMLVALLIVVALICVVVFVLKRLMGGAPMLVDQKLGRVIGRIYLTPKAVLYLVRVGGKVLLIGTTPTTINLIAEMTGEELVAELDRTRSESVTPKVPFAGQVSQFLSKFGAAQRIGDEEAKLEEYLRDIKGQMAKLNALIGGSENEERE